MSRHFSLMVGTEVEPANLARIISDQMGIEKPIQLHHNKLMESDVFYPECGPVDGPQVERMNAHIARRMLDRLGIAVNTYVRFRHDDETDFAEQTNLVGRAAVGVLALGKDLVFKSEDTVLLYRRGGKLLINSDPFWADMLTPLLDEPYELSDLGRY